MKPSLAVIVPVFNGASFIRENALRLHSFLKATWPEFELVVVNDGSSDDTETILNEITEKEIRVLHLPKNEGKFGAIIAGMRSTEAPARIFFDADLPYNIHAIPYMARLLLEKRFDAVVGDRTLAESVATVHRRKRRRLASRVFATCVRLLVTGGVFDTQCGLKGFRGAAADLLFPLLKDRGFSGDVELLYLVLKYNLSIRRIPVVLEGDGPSSVRLSVHSLRMLMAILLLPLRWRRGLYESAPLRRFAEQRYW